MSFWFEKKQGWMIQQKSTIRIAQLLLFFLPVMFLEERKINCNCHTITHHWRGRETCFHKSTSDEPVEVLVDFLDSAFIFFSSQILNKKINLASWRSCKALGIQTSNVRRHLDPNKNLPHRPSFWAGMTGRLGKASKQHQTLHTPENYHVP